LIAFLPEDGGRVDCYVSPDAILEFGSLGEMGEGGWTGFGGIPDQSGIVYNIRDAVWEALLLYFYFFTFTFFAILLAWNL